MSTRVAEDVVAAELVAARREGRSLTGFPGVIPASMAEAYQIQELAMSRWPDSLVGWKIGYISADRRMAGDPDRLVGPIWRQQYHLSEQRVSAAEVGIFASGFAAVEAELVIRLGQDLPARDGGSWTAQEAADLEQHLLVGIEVASSPIPDITARPDSDRRRLRQQQRAGARLGSCGLAWWSSGPACLLRRRATHGRGICREPARGFIVVWRPALNILASRGQPVRAGMVFATGAITGIHPIGPGQHCRVEVRDGPSVELRTVDARTLLRR